MTSSRFGVPAYGDGDVEQHVGQSVFRRLQEFEKNGPPCIGRSRGGLTTKIYVVALNGCWVSHCLRASARCPGGGSQTASYDSSPAAPPAYGPPRLCRRPHPTHGEGMQSGPVVPPKSTRRKPWAYDRELCARRNEIERRFGRLKRYRRVGTRYDKLDVLLQASFISHWFTKCSKIQCEHTLVV